MPVPHPPQSHHPSPRPSQDEMSPHDNDNAIIEDDEDDKQQEEKRCHSDEAEVKNDKYFFEGSDRNHTNDEDDEDDEGHEDPGPAKRRKIPSLPIDNALSHSMSTVQSIVSNGVTSLHRLQSCNLRWLRYDRKGITDIYQQPWIMRITILRRSLIVPSIW